MSVSAKFDKFRSSLEIDASTVREAAKLRDTVQDGLKKRLEGHRRSFVSGSYARWTRLDPLNDIDIVGVVESTAPWGDDPEAAMIAAGEAVRPDFPGSSIRLGAHAAKVKPKDPAIPDVHVDIVIAKETGDGTMLVISEREPGSSWKMSDPEAHAAALSKANDAWTNRLVPTIKQVKHWNRSAAGAPLPSFLVEALALRIFTGSGEVSASTMVQRFFNESKDAISSPTKSPAVSDGFVDNDLTAAQRDAHSIRLRRASLAADAAIAAEKAGDESGAEAIWYGLFGDPFPTPDNDDRKAKMAEAIRTGTAGVAGGTIIGGAGRAVVPGRSYGGEPQ
jgi:hypothetical protein